MLTASQEYIQVNKTIKQYYTNLANNNKLGIWDTVIYNLDKLSVSLPVKTCIFSDILLRIHFNKISFSVFSLCEYVVILSNMAYHATSYYDFYHVNINLSSLLWSYRAFKIIKNYFP